MLESFSANRKKEEPEDVARVVSGFCHAVMLRTHEHNILERFASKSGIPLINGLSDTHHPCQALADLLTLKETFDMRLHVMMCSACRNYRSNVDFLRRVCKAAATPSQLPDEPPKEAP